METTMVKWNSQSVRTNSDKNGKNKNKMQCIVAIDVENIGQPGQ